MTWFSSGPGSAGEQLDLILKFYSNLADSMILEVVNYLERRIYCDSEIRLKSTKFSSGQNKCVSRFRGISVSQSTLGNHCCSLFPLPFLPPRPNWKEGNLLFWKLMTSFQVEIVNMVGSGGTRVTSLHFLLGKKSFSSTSKTLMFYCSPFVLEFVHFRRIIQISVN